MNKNKVTFFDYLKAILSKTKLPYNKKVCSIYMILLYLSQEQDLLPITNNANKMIGVLSDEAIYNYLFHTIPKGSRFIKYTKKSSTRSKDESIDYLVKYKGLSIEEAQKSIF